jgi:proteic killer suppression protein
VKKFGKERANLFLRRLIELEGASSLEECRNLPGKYHAFVGDRKGQWACNLEHPYRLIFEPHENPIPTDSSGRYIWIEIKGI